MKRIVLLMIPALICGMVLFGCSSSIEELKEDKIEGELVRIDGSIYVVENGKLWLIDQTVVIVKLKPEINEVPNDLIVIHTNPLGFISLSVPDGVDVEEFATMLKKTGLFEIVEYNTFGEWC